MRNIVYLGGSKVGGTYRVFLNLRQGLAERGVNLSLEGAADLVAAVGRDEVLDAANRLIDRLSRSDGVIVNVFMATAMMNIARYLPAALPRVMVVHSITHATLQAARALRDFVHVTIGVSPRIRDDLVRLHGFDPETTMTVLNALDPACCGDPSIPRPHSAVLSLGRIEDCSKGILQLPKIFDSTAARHATLTIAGDGPDLDRLQSAFKSIGVEPSWAGLVQPEQVRDIYERHAIFLFPSRFEGMGLALAEAMTSGLIPVAARIRGVTDHIIIDEENGFLFEQGDVAIAQRRLWELIANPERVSAMRIKAAARGNELFALSSMAKAYHEVFCRIRHRSLPTQPLPVESWAIPRRMQPGLRALIPQRLRRQIGNIALRLR